MSRYFITASLILSLLGLVSIKVLDLIYQKQKVPYIDEIFHVHQAQLYCNNSWSEWNPKITTLPGLYLISFLILKPFDLLGFNDFCSLYALRLTNVIATTLNFILSLQIIVSLEKKHRVTSPGYVTVLSALNITIFPPLYFFTFLYYTDVWSSTFILLMYNMHLSQKKFSKLSVALSCVMAVLMRQTNIIWIGLLIIDKSWEILTKNFKNNSFQDFNYTVKLFSSLFSFKGQDSMKLINLVWTIFFETYHFMLICVAFVIFVIMNGGIVMGDKTAHKPMFHPMQNLYFLNFAIFFGLPFAFIEFLSILKKPPGIFLIVFLLGLFTTLSEINKVEHPYLLADNRHLAFYIWKRIFGHRIIRRIIVPTYVFSGIVFFRTLKRRCYFMFAVGLSVCIFLNLTPQHLFELRYFIIPFLIWRLQFKQHPVVIIEMIFFTVINISVIYLFLNKSFFWTSEPGVKQRFIW